MKNKKLNQTKESVAEAMDRAARSRYSVIEDFNSDPYLGFKTLEESQEGYKLNSQTEVLSRLLNGENLFISGPAGSGKTTIINKFIEVLDADTDGKANVAVTASTGIAASLIGGKTIHSWSGIGISTDPFDKRNVPPQCWARRDGIVAADVLIIDEISMLPYYLFEKLNALMKYFRRSSKPFGGVQLVLLGDFMQLPPVSKGNEKIEVTNASGEKEKIALDTGFCIGKPAWKEAKMRHLYMDKTHRATDKKLKYVLHKISTNSVDDIARKLINARKGDESMADPNKTYTRLYTTNSNVDKFNQQEYLANPNPEKVFSYYSEGEDKYVKQLLKSNNIPELLKLKVGTKVMLTANVNLMGEFLPNGSLGVVTKFLGGHVYVRFNNGETYEVPANGYRHSIKETIKLSNGSDLVFERDVATVNQLPLKLAYAITVHKSQGQTFDGVICDLSKCFTPGLGYVALSRVRSLDDLIVLDVNERAYKVGEKSLAISNGVKKLAKKARNLFEEEKEDYNTVLTEHLYRREVIRNEITTRIEVTDS